ncbi:hypothetical protein K2P47_04535 [Patescibacteria group bacterium]|nr:hypothetical protein [Patescibacteria group bacterium]
MEDTITATTTRLEVVGFDFLTPLLRAIFGSDGLFAGFSQDGLLGFLNSTWSVYVIIAYICSFIFLALYIYASIQAEKYQDIEHDLVHAQEEAYAMKMSGGIKSDKFAELQAHLDSENPNDWKLAIIEADIILDDTLKRQGYAGPTLGDRLKSISPDTLRSIDDAWQAHKVRNQIAHAGADFVLTQRIARETIMQYERVFKELGVGEGGGGHH